MILLFLWVSFEGRRVFQMPGAAANHRVRIQYEDVEMSGPSLNSLIEACGEVWRGNVEANPETETRTAPTAHRQQQTNRRKLSAKARKAISEAQIRRHAKEKAQQRQAPKTMTAGA
jgi:hypothetical protein